MERRKFLKYSTLFSTGLYAEASLFRKTSLLVGNPEGILVVIELEGGCDGLNTVIPYRNSIYYVVRPNLAISPQKVIKITDSLGFHPSFVAFKELFERGNIAIVQGVGYPNPNRCHLRSGRIWHTAKVEEASTDGWLARYFDHEHNSSNVQGVHIGIKIPDAMNSTTRSVKKHIATPKDLNDSLKKQNRYRSHVEYPGTTFAANLRTIAKIIAADHGVRVFYTSISGFDTHINQVENGNNITGFHAELLKTVSLGIKAFFEDIKRMRKEREVLIMTFSEFGRRVNENASAGTDHGTAGPMFFIGGKVRPGFYGEHPALEDSELDGAKDMIHKVDFRSVYSTVLAKWMGADPVSIIGEPWPLLSFV